MLFVRRYCFNSCHLCFSSCHKWCIFLHPHNNCYWKRAKNSIKQTCYNVSKQELQKSYIRFVTSMYRHWGNWPSPHSFDISDISIYIILNTKLSSVTLKIINFCGVAVVIYLLCAISVPEEVISGHGAI